MVSVGVRLVSVRLCSAVRISAGLCLRVGVVSIVCSVLLDPLRVTVTCAYSGDVLVDSLKRWYVCAIVLVTV